MAQEEGHSDHRWGPGAGDSTMCKHLEEVDMVHLETAEEDTGESRAGGLLVRPRWEWTLPGRRS
jgi:hypothetical protein